MCRACVLKALKDIANYFTKEQGQVAVSKGEYESAAHQSTVKPVVLYASVSIDMNSACLRIQKNTITN